MRKKEKIVTFKVSGDLADDLDGIPNKSEFIRRAVEAALSGKCPLCAGTGVLSVDQQQHMRQFLLQHPLEKCEQCQALHFVCHGNIDVQPQ